jgi:hypothetical protein
LGKKMEKNLKRLSLALLALGLSAPAFAENCVRVPSQQGGFKVGIDALYLRPTNNDLAYATVIAAPVGTEAGFQRNAIVDPSFDWGFYAQVGYLFPCTGNDLTLGYTYLRTDEKHAVDVRPGVTPGTGPVISLLPVGSGAIFGSPVTFASAEGKNELDINAIDLEAGQRFTRCAYDMRMFAGVRYANIDHTLQAVGRPFAVGSGEDNTTVTGAQQFKSEYRGIGPRLGVDGRYCLNSGFGIDGNLSTSLLVGTLDSTYRAARITTGTGPDAGVAAFQAKDGSRTRIVPVLEAKLGVDYTHIIDCRCKSSIVFEAGYQVTNYFNAVDRPRVVNAPPPAVVPAQPVLGSGFAYQGTGSDVSFDGPYVGVKYYA